MACDQIYRQFLSITVSKGPPHTEVKTTHAFLQFLLTWSFLTFDHFASLFWLVVVEGHIYFQVDESPRHHFLEVYHLI